MPSGDAILAGLTEAANTWRWLAVVWHGLLAAVVVASLAAKRLSNRLTAFVAVALVLSVSAVAWVTGNLFNGIVFAALGIVLLVAATRVHSAPIRFEAPSRAVPGTALVVFGVAYPHFLVAESWTEYVYAAPLGLIPCPTLAVVIGFTLMLGSLGTATWRVPLVVAGVFYGVVGVFGLGVLIDVALLAGTVILGVAATIGCRSDHPGLQWVSQPIVRLVHFITQRKQLLEIAKRVERSPSEGSAPSDETDAQRRAS